MDHFLLSHWVLTHAIIVLLIIFFINIILYAIHKFVHFNFLRKHQTFIISIFTTFGVLYTVILGFTLVNSQQNLNTIISQINEEAYLSEALYQSLNVFPEKTRLEAQKQVMEYMISIVKEEWPLMKESMESPFTLMKLEKMWKSFYNIQPQTEVEKIWYSTASDIILKQSSARLKRIYSTWNSIDHITWEVLIIGAIILITFSLFLQTSNFIIRSLFVSLFSASIILLLLVIYAFDNPFDKPINIQPKSYQIIYNYDKKTRGTTISPENVDFTSKLYLK
jgi:hypothetical protein